MMLRNAAAQLNQAFSTVAAAGLANTGAGADIIAGQQQDVFHRAQDRAFAQVNQPGFLESRYEFARSSSPNLLSSIGTIASGAFEQYNRYKQRGGVWISPFFKTPCQDNDEDDCGDPGADRVVFLNRKPRREQQGCQDCEEEHACYYGIH